MEHSSIKCLPLVCSCDVAKSTRATKKFCKFFSSCLRWRWSRHPEAAGSGWVTSFITCLLSLKQINSWCSLLLPYTCLCMQAGLIKIYRILYSGSVKTGCTVAFSINIFLQLIIKGKTNFFCLKSIGNDHRLRGENVEMFPHMLILRNSFI